MSKLTDQVSYVKGLADGLNVDEGTKEGKILLKVLDLLQALANENEELRKEIKELDDYVDSIDEDLASLEEVVLGDEDDFDCDCDDDCDCGCHCHCDEDEDDDDEDDGIVEYACPHCGAEMTFEVDNFDFDDDYLCPNCHKPLFPEEEEEDEEEDDE